MLTVLFSENAPEMLNMARATRHTIVVMKKYSDMVCKYEFIEFKIC
jgi:hypothetical protein